MGLVGVVEDDTSMLEELFSEAVVNGMRSEIADSGVAVLEVVPLEERPGEVTRSLDGFEPAREARTVLERLELAFGVRVVV